MIDVIAMSAFVLNAILLTIVVYEHSGDGCNDASPDGSVGCA